MILSHENGKVYIQEVIGGNRVELNTQHHWLQNNLIDMLKRIDDLLAANTELVLQNRKLRHSHLALVDLVEAKRAKEEGSPDYQDLKSKAWEYAHRCVAELEIENPIWPIVIKAKWDKNRLENENGHKIAYIMDRDKECELWVRVNIASYEIPMPKDNKYKIATEMTEHAFSKALNHPVTIEIVEGE